MPTTLKTTENSLRKINENHIRVTKTFFRRTFTFLSLQLWSVYLFIGYSCGILMLPDRPLLLGCFSTSSFFFTA